MTYTQSVPVLLVILATACGIEKADTANNCTYYLDRDEDGYGNPETAVTTADCAEPPGYSGYVFDSTDCNDGESSAHPGETEICDGFDNDCDDRVDEGCDDLIDADGDGYYGDGSNPSTVDCDDENAAVYPGATEICDGLDNNCDGHGELDAVDITMWYNDLDNDLYGDPRWHTLSCDQPEGFVIDSTDCDDRNPAINPGATEICDDLDNDCDEAVDEDCGI